MPTGTTTTARPQLKKELPETYKTLGLPLHVKNLTRPKTLRPQKHPKHDEVTQLVHFKDDEFEVETASTVEEAKELLKIGFDYTTEKNGVMLFRRPERFASLGYTNEG